MDIISVVLHKLLLEFKFIWTGRKTLLATPDVHTYLCSCSHAIAVATHCHLGSLLPVYTPEGHFGCLGFSMMCQLDPWRINGDILTILG